MSYANKNFIQYTIKNKIEIERRDFVKHIDKYFNQMQYNPHFINLVDKSSILPDVWNKQKHTGEKEMNHPPSIVLAQFSKCS